MTARACMVALVHPRTGASADAMKVEAPEGMDARGFAESVCAAWNARREAMLGVDAPMWRVMEESR